MTNPAEILGLPKPAWAADEVGMLYDMAHRFMSEEIAPRYDEFEKNEMVDRESWLKAGAAGLLCASMPEEYGGSGGTFAHERHHRGHRPCRRRRLRHRSAQFDRRPLHPPLRLGGAKEEMAAEARHRRTDRRHRHDGARRRLRPARRQDAGREDGNQYKINGSKTFITNGQLANFIIVVTKTDPAKGAKGTSLIVVETDEVDGFERGRNLDKIGLKANDTSELFFNGARVPTSNLLGHEEGQGFIQLMQQLPQERLQIGTGAIAMVERALALTIEYVKERKAFGKAVIDFQNTQFKLAELKTEATIGRVFYNDCVARHIDGGLDPVTASMAKYWLSDLQGKVVDECLQLHGGYGYMNEYPIARMFRDARVQRIYGGTNEIMKLLIGRSL